MTGRCRTPDDAAAELADATTELRAARERYDNSRPWHRRRARQALGEAVWRHTRAVDDIARQRVGSDPRRWGLLSDDLEYTIEGILESRCDNPKLATRLNAIREQLIWARLEAYHGDHTRERALTRKLVDCLNLQMSDDVALSLVHHLPGSARPIPPVDIRALAQTPGGIREQWFDERYFAQMGDPDLPLSTLTVTFETTRKIRLNDIHVIDRYRSQGLGTAALEHLCRCADHYRLRIIGDIMPQDRTEESAAKLARWYRRHGFDVTQTSPGEWLWAKINRAPKPGDPER